MALASIWYTNGSIRPISPEKAVEAWNALNGVTEPTPEQAKFLNTVWDIFIPPSYRDQAKGYLQAHRHAAPGGIVPSGYDAEKAAGGAENGLENGVLQGKSEIVPRGDR